MPTLVLVCMIAQLQPDAQPAPTKSAPQPATIDQWGQPPDLGEMVARTLVATGVVLALAVASIFALRLFLKPVPAQATSDSELLSLQARMRLGPRAWLLMIRAGGNDVLVALDQNGIQHVAVLPVPFGDEGWQQADGQGHEHGTTTAQGAESGYRS